MPFPNINESKMMEGKTRVNVVRSVRKAGARLGRFGVVGLLVVGVAWVVKVYVV